MKKKLIVLLLVLTIMPFSNLFFAEETHAYFNDGQCSSGRCWDFKNTFGSGRGEYSFNDGNGLYFDGGYENNLTGTIYNPYRRDVTVVFDFYTQSGALVLTHSKRTTASTDSYSWNLSQLNGLYKIKTSWRGSVLVGEESATYTTGRVNY